MAGDANKTLDFVRLHAGLTPAKLALVDLKSEQNWTYQALDQRIDQCCSALAAHINIAPSSTDTAANRVAVIAKNCADYIVVHLACSRLGLIFVPINWRLSTTEIKALLDDCHPALIIGDDCLNDHGIDGLSFDNLGVSLRQTTPDNFSDQVLCSDKDQTALILYTSGTTGRPKGVMLSEANLLATGRNFSILGQVTHQSVFLCDAPMFHVIGLISNLRPVLQNGATLLVSDGFTPPRTLERMGNPELAVTHYFCVPQMANALRNLPEFDATKLMGLTAIFTGGAPHPSAQIRAWTDHGIACVDGFGMSEVGTVSGMPVNIKQIEANAGAVGLTTPEVQTRIVDGNDKPCADGEIGELQIKGPNVFSHYWNQVDATAKAFSADGWFKSGDLFTRDKSGYLRLVGRSKDMYISGGENVYPAEIEAVLAGHGDIQECAVIGQADAKWGEVGHLFLVPDKSAQDEQGTANHVQLSEAILIFLSEKIAKYKMPKHVTMLSALPRGGTGKVDKKSLSEHIAERPK